MALHQKHWEAIRALLTTTTVKEAAAEARLDPSTIYRYCEDAEFRDEITRAQRQRVELLIAGLVAGGEDAVGAIHKVMMDEDEPGYSRLQAARVMLEWRTKLLEMQEMRERLEAIEARLDGQGAK
mgnify:CR=1 FL=1